MESLKVVVVDRFRQPAEFDWGGSIQRLFPDGGSRRGNLGVKSRGCESDKKCLVHPTLSLQLLAYTMTRPVAFRIWYELPIPSAEDFFRVL
jgi:hypothetical protein